MCDGTFGCLIPVPVKISYAEGRFPITGLHSVSYPQNAAACFSFLKAACKVLGIAVSESDEAAAGLILRQDPGLAREAWKLAVTPGKIFLTASDANGFLYGTSALVQILAAGLVKGRLNEAFLDCGSVEDSPRFGWRGFMLDSARHFQSAETIRKLIFFLAAFRINSFHWHLSDNQAWRWETGLVPGLAGKGEYEDGFYTKEEIRGIVDFAEKLGIRILPEMDVPGHSRRLLSLRPDLACDGSRPGSEFCLGNPESLPFLKQLLEEFMDLFPHSKIIHLGGDEAGTAAWEKCPRCRSALKERKLDGFRRLENEFMHELTQFVLSRGRIPMLWGTCSGQKYDPRTIMQPWLDIREPIRLAQDGNKIVYSVHNSFYFDYPANPGEPHESWMFELSERGVYMADPYVIWADKVKDSILGTEACLWTETVPEWRIMQKTLPRIFAYSECAWSMPDRKDYHAFVRRRERLESAGYLDILRAAAPSFC